MATISMAIGHSKTGSSFLQSAVAGSVDALARQGIAYPIDEAARQRAAAGVVTTGNHHAFLDYMRAWPGPADARVLFCSELFFRDVINPEARARLRAALDRDEVEKVRVLLFLRDPISFACSSYVQQVRGNNGLTDDLLTYLREVIPMRLERVAEVIEEVQSWPGTELTVRNYSFDADRLMAVLEDWLGVPSGTISSPGVGTVNRSLSRAEVELQRALNKRLGGPAGRLLAHPLTEQLPNLKPGDIRPPLEVQEEVWATNAASIARIHALVPPEARYDRARDIRAPAPAAEGFAFGPEQLEVIAGCMVDAAAEVERLREQLKEARLRINGMRGRGEPAAEAEAPPTPNRRPLPARPAAAKSAPSKAALKAAKAEAKAAKQAAKAQKQAAREAME